MFQLVLAAPDAQSRVAVYVGDMYPPPHIGHTLTAPDAQSRVPVRFFRFRQGRV